MRKIQSLVFWCTILKEPTKIGCFHQYGVGQVEASWPHKKEDFGYPDWNPSGSTRDSTEH